MAQLQARYPNASLIAEFVTIHHESFVVRALVQVGGITLATGMAAATQIEQAEDRAKTRVLAALGIGNLTAPIQSQSASYPLSSPTIFDPSFDSSAGLPSSKPRDRSDAEAVSNSLTNSQSPAPLTEPSPTQAIASTPSISDSPLDFTTPASFAPLPQIDSDRSEYEFSYEPESYELENYESKNDEPEADSPSPIAPTLETNSLPVEASTLSTQPDEASSVLPKSTAPTGKGKSKRKAESAEVTLPPVEENDRSEEIAKIGLEMKRLGWTTEQGRNYLKRTYGKRSRQELDDAELIDFLRYLEAQISPSESPF